MPRIQANEAALMLAKKPTDDAPEATLRPLVAVATVAFALCFSSGCRLCCDREDPAYAAYGGLWERTERNSGRVGSLFDPAGARVADLTDREAPAENDDARSNIIPPQRLDREPQDADEPQQPEPQKPDDETEEEFQERLRKFEEEQMLKAMIIPGEPAPPQIR